MNENFSQLVLIRQTTQPHHRLLPLRRQLALLISMCVQLDDELGLPHIFGTPIWKGHKGFDIQMPETVGTPLHLPATQDGLHTDQPLLLGLGIPNPNGHHK